MLSLLSLLSPTFWKYLAIIGLVLAAVFGIYEQGHHAGYTEGYAASDAKSAPVIKTLQDTITTDRNNVAAKAQTLITTSNSDVANISQSAQTNLAKVTAVAKRYTPATKPLVSVTSGCSTSASVVDYSWIIQGINAQIDTTFGDSK